MSDAAPDDDKPAADVVDPVPLPPVPQAHHRDVQGGVARASVFGASDGLVSNLSLIMLMAGADPAPSVVRLAGIGGLLAGAVSMAAGEWISMKAQAELFERELEIERTQLERQPHVETVELTQIYMARGVDPDTARQMATELMADPDRALETHAREELGIDPSSLGSPYGAAAGSFASFSVGAFIPLLPWLVADGTPAVVASITLAVAAAGVIGWILARFTGRPRWKSSIRQMLFAFVPACMTFAIGAAIGIDGGI